MSTPIVSVDSGIYFATDTKRFRTYDATNAVGATKDGVLWAGITSATLYLVSPAGQVSSFAGVQEAAGIWYADAVIPAGEGDWHRYWKLSDGTITETWGRVVFTVRAVD